MTTVVMDPPLGPNVPNGSGPIFLTVNVDGKAGYLVGDNRLLLATYRQPVERYDLTVEPGYFYPDKPPSAELLVALSEQRRMPVSEVRTHLSFEGWLTDKANLMLKDQFSLAIGGVCKADEDRVASVLFDEALYLQDSTIYDLLRDRFTDAGLFVIDSNKRSDWPREVFGPPVAIPICPNCSTKMRPAGTAFVCEGCGNTANAKGEITSSGKNEVRCSECGSLMTFDKPGLMGSDIYGCTNPGCDHFEAV